MRHIVGLVLGIVLAPLLLYALGWAAAAAGHAWSAESSTLSMDAAVPGGALVLIGVAIAFLARGYPRLGAFVVGAAFVTLNVLYLAYLPAVEAVLRPFGPVRLDWTGAYGLLRTGVVGMIGVVLLVSALAPRAWRRDAIKVDEDYLTYLKSGPEPAWSGGQAGQERSPVPAAQETQQVGTSPGATAAGRPTRTETVVDGG